MAGDALGHIQCDACGGVADIKKRGNSKLLYVTCPAPECKRLDMGTAAKLQEKWQEAIDTPWRPDNQTHSAKTAELNAKVALNLPEPEPENTLKKPSKWALLGVAGVVVVAAFFGVRVNQ